MHQNQLKKIKKDFKGRFYYRKINVASAKEAIEITDI